MAKRGSSSIPVPPPTAMSTPALFQAKCARDRPLYCGPNAKSCLRGMLACCLMQGLEAFLLCRNGRLELPCASSHEAPFRFMYSATVTCFCMDQGLAIANTQSIRNYAPAARTLRGASDCCGLWYFMYCSQTNNIYDPKHACQPHPKQVCFVVDIGSYRVVRHASRLVRGASAWRSSTCV